MPAALVLPNLYTGYYSPRRGRVARYPGLWRGCFAAWNPGLGTEGPNLRDHGSYSQSVSINSMVPSIRSGQKCLQVNSSYATFNHRGEAGKANAFSVSLWLCRTTTNPGNLKVWTEASNANVIIVDDRNGFTPSIQFYVRSGFSGPAVNYSGYTLPASTWTHIACVYRSGYMAIWVNGREKATGSTTFTMPNSSASTQVFGDSGGASWKDYATDYLVYNRVLSPSEIALLASRPGVAYERLTTRRWFVPASSGGSQTINATNAADLQLSAVAAAAAGSGTASITASSPGDMLLTTAAPTLAPSGSAPATATNAATMQLTGVSASVAGSGTAGRTVSATADITLSAAAPSCSGSGSAAVSATSATTVQLSAVSASASAGGSYISVANAADLQFSAVSASISASGSASVSVTNVATLNLGALAAFLTHPGSSPGRGPFLCRWNVLLLP